MWQNIFVMLTTRWSKIWFFGAVCLHNMLWNKINFESANMFLNGSDFCFTSEPELRQKWTEYYKGVAFLGKLKLLDEEEYTEVKIIVVSSV